MRILIVSNMNAAQPYGAWARTNYLGQALSHHAEILQLGFDTSDVTYGQALSTHAKDIPAYMRAIRRAVALFNPDVIYCHETFPAVAAYLVARLDQLAGKKTTPQVYDIHAVHAAEYKAMLNDYDSRLHGLYLFAKSYYSQRLIARSGAPLIAASSEGQAMLMDWYRIPNASIYIVPNGAPVQFLTAPLGQANPYPPGYRNALLVAPKNMMPNELAVRLTIQVAQRLQALPNSQNIRIVVAGGGWRSEQIEKSPNVKYLGFVDDLMAHIDYADLCLLPYPPEAVCGGARNKALDYFSRGKCVLSTEEGLRGLSDFKPGEQVFLSQAAPESFAQDMLEIIANLDTHRRVGEKARQLVVTDYNWQSSATKVLSAFEQILQHD